MRTNVLGRRVHEGDVIADVRRQRVRHGAGRVRVRLVQMLSPYGIQPGRRRLSYAVDAKKKSGKHQDEDESAELQRRKVGRKQVESQEREHRRRR